MYQELSSTKCNFYVLPGDSIQLIHRPFDGGEDVIITEIIKEECHITVCKVCKFTDMFGLKEGYVGVFGRE